MAETTSAAMPAEVRQKISKMVVMLGSPEPGDVCNAASAIVKALRAHGFDLHAFAEYIAFGQQLQTSDLTRILAAELRGRIKEACAIKSVLTEAECKFVREFGERLDCGIKTTTWKDYVRLAALCRDVRLRTGKR